MRARHFKFGTAPEDTARFKLATALLSVANEDSGDVEVLNKAALQRMVLDYRGHDADVLRAQAAREQRLYHDQLAVACADEGLPRFLLTNELLGCPPTRVFSHQLR